MNETLLLSGWRKNALLLTLFLVSTFSQIDRVLPFILGESIKKDLQLSDTELGLIMGLAFTLCYSLASIPLARIADNGKAHTVLLACILIWTVMTGLGGLAISFITLAISRIGVALGEAGGTPASHAIIANRIAYKKRGSAIGLFAMGIPAGTMIGFGVGGWAAENIGWRSTLIGAGLIGTAIAILVYFFTGKNWTPSQRAPASTSFMISSRELLANPAFLSLFVAATLMGFAAAPFYTFSSLFLIRTFSMSTTQAGLVFGLLQGLTGLTGTILGGRLFDKTVKSGSKKFLSFPAILICITSITFTLALFTSSVWLSIALMVPTMFAFSFLLPQAFCTSHLVAGEGKQALASGLILLATQLLGSSLAPVLVGIVSDAATAVHISNGLQYGMLIVPVFSLTSGLALYFSSKKVERYLQQQESLLHIQ